MPSILKAGSQNAGNRDEFWIREKCFVREFANTADITAFSLAETRVEPGVTTELHQLSVDEWYIMSSGLGMVEVGDEGPVEVGPGDIVEIPAGTSQRINNPGNEDLVFFCVCLPRFTPDCYESLEAE